MKLIHSEFSFLRALWRFNLLSAMEYRVSFFTQSITMILNNAIYFVFWVLFFEKFESLAGWNLDDMFLLVSIITCGFGIAFALFGNGTRLAGLIEQGQIDYYLALPRDTLLHILASRCSVSAIGDVIFGIIMFCFAGHYSFPAIGLWLICTLIVAAILIAYVSIVGSLAFWLGRASILSEQAIGALLTFSMYPSRIFDGITRFVLFTLVPAGLVSVFPVEIVKNLNGWLLVVLLVIAIVMVYLAWTVFRLGLKRYESGNLMNINI